MKEEIFATTIWMKDIDIDPEYWAKVCVDWSLTHEGVTKSNHSGYQSEESLHLQEPFKDILQVIMNSIREQAINRNDLIFSAMWCNINRYMDINTLHGHANYLLKDVLSGCLYLRVPSNSGMIGLEDPRTLNLGSDHMCYMPNSRMLMLFPMWLRHRVLPNLNKDELRISLAFNIGIKD